MCPHSDIFFSSTSLLYLGCPVGGAPSPLSLAPQTLHICPPSTSASNRSGALLSTCPHLPPLLYTTSGSILQWATLIRLTVPPRKFSLPMGRRSFPKPTTHKMERKEGSRSGSYTWVTAGRDSQLLQSATISHSAVTNKTRWGRDVSPTSQNEMPLFVSSHRAGLSENSSLLHLLNPTRRQMRRLMHTDFYFVFCFC